MLKVPASRVVNSLLNQSTYMEEHPLHDALQKSSLLTRLLVHLKRPGAHPAFKAPHKIGVAAERCSNSWAAGMIMMFMKSKTNKLLPSVSAYLPGKTQLCRCERPGLQFQDGVSHCDERGGGGEMHT